MNKDITKIDRSYGSEAPLVSVIMPNYNKEGYALIAAESVLSQTYANVELIFIDDHSSDQSAQQVRELALKDPRIKMFCTPAERSGGAAARNIGLESASGPYVIFLDSDDWMAPDCLDERVNAFSGDADMDFLVFQMGIFNDAPYDTNLVANCGKDIPDLNRFFLRDQPWLISGPIWKRTFLNGIGGFDTRLSTQQDADLHTRALIASDRYRCIYGSPKVFYRQNVSSLARSESQSYQGLLQRSEMLGRHIALLQEAEMLSADVARAIAQYLLDLAQMLRWYGSKVAGGALTEAYAIWAQAHDEHLVSEKEYRCGMAYIRFKHNMLWNRFPRLMAKREQKFRARLGDLVYYPSSTLSKVKLS